MENIYRAKHLLEEQIERIEDELHTFRLNYAINGSDSIQTQQSFHDKESMIKFRLNILRLYLKIINKYLNHYDLAENELIIFKIAVKYFEKR